MNYKIDIPEGNKGDWKVEKYIDDKKDRILQLSSLFNSGRYVPTGTYTRLMRNNTCVMTDTPDEIRDSISFIYRAFGKVLIAGLGLGVVLNAICMKEEVKHVTVIEISQDVIDLVGKYWLEKYPGKITIIKSDILEYIPAKELKWDCAWYDIWDDLCTDNLEQMTKIHRKFAKRVKLQQSWGKELLKYRKKKEDEQNKVYQMFRGKV